MSELAQTPVTSTPPPSSLKESLQGTFQSIYSNLRALSDHVSKDGQTKHAQIVSQLTELEKYVNDLIATKESDNFDISLVSQSDLPEDWTFLGAGNFGSVFEISFHGSRSAIKIFSEEASSKLNAETNLLRGLSHDNIIAYRGMGYIDEDRLCRLTKWDKDKDNEITELFRFLIMEYIPYNLDTYVSDHNTPDSPGLPDDQTWIIGEKIASALNYLHSKGIAHRDLKPDNILYDPGKHLVKVADFGLAWRSDFVNTKTVFGSSAGSAVSSLKNRGTSSSTRHVRWGPPEFFSDVNSNGREEENIQAGKPQIERFKRGDIWCCGMILSFLITGKKPFGDILTFDIIRPGGIPIKLPGNLRYELRNIVEGCSQQDPRQRLTADQILSKFEEGHSEFLKPPSEKEFFSCGFMKKTDIFVADSCVSEDTEGYFNTGVRPDGYEQRFLLCPMETNSDTGQLRPEDWDLDEKYWKIFDQYKTKAEQRIIDDNPFVALKEMTISRPGAEEIQLLELRFQQSTYCHHRTMREIWTKELRQDDRHREVPCKSLVHKYFSTSFGLHVAILTNEGTGSKRKFIFCRRARKPGMSAPGVITCGAVESCSVNDYVQINGETRVNLVKVAKRGLQEELGLELSETEMQAITLNTVYLKFDFHEWGLCGFVDLCDERISFEHQISAANLEDQFTSGPKDKFEHQSIFAVDFELDKMVDFVYERHHEFASSAKLVVVKVLQAFFGVGRVQKQFELKSASK